MASASNDGARAEPFPPVGPERMPDGTTGGGGSVQTKDGVSVDVERVQSGVERKRGQWFRYIRTREFWLVLLFGQILALCIVGTNTFSSLLTEAGANIPAFQTFFNYVLLNAVWTTITVYKYGAKGWWEMFKTQGWRYAILSFCDVEGNYFTVLGFRYTTILSAQLINFWAIVVVVIISFLFMKVRYGWPQVAGIVTCVAGMGLLLASDHITHASDFPAENQLKGDLFALLGATCYGFSNVLQEWLVSKRPLYEVVGMIGFWGMLINGVQAAIFDRESFRAAVKVYKPAIGGYIAGFDLLLCIFYSIAPLVFRMGSAAFLNISLLTGNFWGTIVGIHVFHLKVHWMYPVAFVLIVLGLFVYFALDGELGEAEKPWLGEGQVGGVDGVGTARRRLERDARREGSEGDEA
ncbi:DUF914-domain-containing protein [Trichodelitschia bisporula]|uniref:DUF914-domain-containing protein n=1 Tax=Trichodelitschia bisporula TaxID=703511 RepID=A0A6G1HY83_9PEZI|nr:DUF914-domain-containing protein [Trichodelitschia bisporula]